MYKKISETNSVLDKSLKLNHIFTQTISACIEEGLKSSNCLYYLKYSSEKEKELVKELKTLLRYKK